MHARGHRSRPIAASRCLMARSPGVTSASSRIRNPHPDVVRRVPRHVRERGQRQRGDTVGGRPVRGVFQQQPAEPAAGAARICRRLLDVQAAVDHGSHQERDRTADLARHDPQQPGGPGFLEFRQRPRVVVRNLGHADATEHLPRRHVDTLQHRKLCRHRVPDSHNPIVAALRSARSSIHPPTHRASPSPAGSSGCITSHCGHGAGDRGHLPAFSGG